MLNRFESLDLRAQIPSLIESTEETIIALNQRQLYTQSIDKDGDPLGGYRSAEYESLKASMNPILGGLVDLNFTGAFYRGFRLLTVDENIFEIDSTDSKSEQLENKYGEAIFGLTEDSLSEYALGAFFDAMAGYIESITKLDFE
jgi:hypothetical protein